MAKKLEHATEVAEPREVYLREGRMLTVADDGVDQLVEVRAASGSIELRIRLTAEGPIVQLDAARLQLRATEAVEIAAKRVTIAATESIEVRNDGDIKVDAKGDVRINGAMIYLN